MLDFHSPLGEKIERRLRNEKIIWLTTVDDRGTPQPRPVWFEWDGQTVLIFSQPQAAKLRHIARNPRVALNFNSSHDGGEVAVLIGEAQILQGSPLPGRLQNLLQKYQEDIKDMGTSPAELERDFSVILLVELKSMRGF